MFEQGKEVCEILSAMCPISYPSLTESPVHALYNTAIVAKDQ